MDDERIDLVFGRTVDQDQYDLTDAETRAALLRETFDPPDDVLVQAGREAVAYQLLFDDPPEAWATAMRLSGLGLTRDEILDQLADAFSPHLLAALEQDDSYNRAVYAVALDRLPQPLAREVESALIAVVRAEPGITSELAVERTVAALARDEATDALETTVEHALDDAVDRFGPLATAGDGLVEVASFLADKTFTRRLTAAEIDTGVIEAGFDLLIHRRRDDLHRDGREIELVATPGGVGWDLDGDWRQSATAGSVVSIRVAADGSVTVALDDPAAPDPEIVATLRAAYDRDVDEFELPVTSEDLVTAMILDHPSSFDEPTAPLSELAEAAGLEIRGSEAAHAEHVWRKAATIAREYRVFRRLRSNERAAGPVLAVLALAESLAGAGGRVDDRSDGLTVHDAFRVLDDLERLSVVTEELFHPPDDGLPQIDPEPFVAASMAGATHDRDRAIALWLTCFVAEGRGDLDAAEAALEEALIANRRYLPAVDRLAWYASDRGDAAKATRLWRSLDDNQAVAEDLQYVAMASQYGHDIGRNDPCWCGSGRKFKQCHLGQSDVAPLADRVPWLAHKGSAFVERRGGQERADVLDVAHARALEPERDASVAVAYSDPLVMDLVLTEGGWFERFLAERGSILPEDEAALGTTWLGVPRTVYEVEEVRDDAGVTMRDLRTGQRVDVSDPSFSRVAKPAMLVCGRAVPNGTGHQFIGGPFPVPPGCESELLAVLEEARANADPSLVAEWVAESERSLAAQRAAAATSR